MTQLVGKYGRWRRKAARFAHLHGFFWLPCELCGEMHGGQEPSGSIPMGEGRGRGICGYCTAERQEAAERRLAELGESITTGYGMSSTGRNIPAHCIPWQGTRS